MFLIHDTENTKQALRIRNLFDDAHWAVLGKLCALSYPKPILSGLSGKEPHHRTTIESSLHIDRDAQGSQGESVLGTDYLRADQNTKIRSV